MPKKTLVRNGDFMSEPSKGWLHDNQALSHGAGVYYSFPVKVITLRNPNAMQGKDKKEEREKKREREREEDRLSLFLLSLG